MSSYLMRRKIFITIRLFQKFYSENINDRTASGGGVLRQIRMPYV